MDDVTVSGTATLSSLSLTGALTVSGVTTLNGAVEVNNKLSVKGDGFELYYSTPYIDFHFGRSTADYTSRIIESTNGTLTIPKNLTVNTLLTATTGAITTLNTATANATNLNVTNNLRATHFDLQTVAQLGGSFYVSPTIKFPNSGTTLVVAKSGNNLTLTITDTSITSTTMAGIVWSANSAVKVSGTINGVVTGTMDGTVSSINTSSHVLTLSVSGENSGSVVAGTYSASQFSDLNVMVYQRRDGSNDYRVGIWMNCYDMANSSSTIRVYGGTSAQPNVVVGNLTNAGLGTINNITPTGWGLYAQNAFLWGAIVSTEGQIGGWTIGDTKLFNGTNSMSSTTAGMYLGTDGFRNYANANTYTNITGGKITAIGADISGVITANTGYIGGTSGWAIASQQLSSGTIGSDNSMFLGTKNLGSNTSIAGRSGSDWRLTVGSNFGVTNTGAVYARSGKIGGWTLASTSLTNGTWGTSGSVMFCTGTSEAKSIGGSASINGWAITAGSTFGVTNTGAMYSTGGKIGGLTISTDSIYMGDTGMSSNTSKWAFWAGETNSENGAVDSDAAFRVGHNGHLVATDAVITGAINATSGSIGGFTIRNNDILNDLGFFWETTIDSVEYNYWCGLRQKGGSASVAPGSIRMFEIARQPTPDGDWRSQFYIGSDGYLFCQAGSIGGWNISQVALMATGNSKTTGIQIPSNGTWSFAAGATDPNNWATAPFRVKHNGEMYSTSGQIGGFTIGANYIKGYNNTFSIFSSTNSAAITFSAGSNSGSSLASTNYVCYNGSKSVDISPNGVIVSDGTIEVYNVTNGGNLKTVTGSVDNGIIITNTNDKSGRFIINNNDNFGIYDNDRSEWVLRRNGTKTWLCGNGYAVRIGEGTSSGLITFMPRTVSDGASNGKINLGAASCRWQKVYTTGGVDTSSDERIKTIHRYLDEDHKKLFMALKPIEYSFIDKPDEKHFGLGAQTTEAAMEKYGFGSEYSLVEHAFYDEEDTYGRYDTYNMNYDEVAMLAVPVVQEHEKEIEKLKARINELETKLSQLMH